jgi:hypothetical protein
VRNAEAYHPASPTAAAATAAAGSCAGQHQVAPSAQVRTGISSPSALLPLLQLLVEGGTRVSSTREQHTGPQPCRL